MPAGQWLWQLPRRGVRLAQRNRPLPEITRNRLKAEQAIRNLEAVERKLWEESAVLDLAEVPALKLYADIQRWKIDKVLPSLKAVEHSGDVSLTHTIKINVGSGNADD